MHDHSMPEHAHRWHLPDGTGLHAPLGELLREDGTGRVCCHLCGGWYVSLGSHVRAHGHTAESYRAELGLCRGEPLSHQELSAAISRRQSASYEADEVHRARLAAGQDAARSGVLGKAAAEARATRPPSAAARSRQARALEDGRATLAARRRAARARLVRESGSADLADHLRTRYGQGASLADLAAETGLGRSGLRDAMRAAGITLRAQGATTGAGRRSRARTADAEAARRVGTDDLAAWLRARREQGWTLAELGAAVGHSGHWARKRLVG